MRMVNLARRPFENLRPVRRLTALMWVLGVGFLLINLWLFWGHLTGFSATRGQLADVRASLRAETEHLDRVEADVAALALEEQNETVSNLNQLIEKRVFPWSLLFDRLEGVLPHDIRLQGVRPQGQEIKIETKRRERTSSTRRRGRTKSRAKPEEPTGVVAVGLNGVSRTEEALLDFVDALWRDPTFDGPTLKGERRNTANEIDFTLDVRFLTQVAASLADQDGSPLEDIEGAIVASDPVRDGMAGVPVTAATAVASAPAMRTPTPDMPTADPPTAAAPQTAATPMDLARAPVNPRASAEDERSATRERGTGRAPSPGLVPRTRLSSGRNEGRTAGEVATTRPPTTGSPRERRPTRATTTPHARPQVPGVVVLPGARPAAQAPIPTSPTGAPTPPATRPADPAAMQSANAPPQPANAPTTDPDTPVPPSPNASAGASLGGGAP